MSNALAIATVTATLRNLLARSIADELGSGGVTARPPDKARDNGDTGNQLNLFLYHVTPDPSWRNQDMPNRVKPGETGHPPLPLRLYYLITAYGRDSDDILSHRLLGKAMQTLHDHTVLNPAEMQATLLDSGLQQQIDRIRLTLQPLSLEEVFRLWSGFQTPYRISVAYEVSVVLVESDRPSRAPLPVLTRGFGDRGVLVQPSLLSPLPTLEQVQFPQEQGSIRLGERLIVQGYNLDSDDGAAIAHFVHAQLPNSIEVPLQPDTAPNTFGVAIADQPDRWLAGFYTVAVRLIRHGTEQTTNTLPLSLAPRLEQINLNPVNQELTVVCRPQIGRDQRVSLFLGSRELLPIIPDDTVPPQRTDILRFDTRRLTAGDYLVRLRVDGVDSLLINRAVQPPAFDPTQKVTLP